jgi:ABC-2 type transport system ATP-binding protein
VLLNSHLIGEVERVCDRISILDHGRVVAEGTLDELLGKGELRLRLGPAPDIARLLGSYGSVRFADGWTVVTGADPGQAPEIVRELVAAGVAVYAVQPARISLEDRLLSVLRHENQGPDDARRADAN